MGRCLPAGCLFPSPQECSFQQTEHDGGSLCIRAPLAKGASQSKLFFRSAIQRSEKGRQSWDGKAHRCGDTTASRGPGKTTPRYPMPCSSRHWPCSFSLSPTGTTTRQGSPTRLKNLATKPAMRVARFSPSVVGGYCTLLHRANAVNLSLSSLFAASRLLSVVYSPGLEDRSPSSHAPVFVTSTFHFPLTA